MQRALWLLGVTSCNTVFGIDDLTADTTAQTSIAASSSATVGAGGGVVSSSSATVGAGGTSQGGAPANRVFVTSHDYPGTFGSISVAHTHCEEEAADAHLGGGGWRAWLSDNAHDAITEIAEAGPWYLLDGTLVAADKAQIVMVGIEHPIELDENGSLRHVAVWTGTNAQGTAAGGLAQHCANWTNPRGTGRVGMSNDTVNDWTSAGTSSCLEEHPLYCFEQ